MSLDRSGAIGLPSVTINGPSFFIPDQTDHTDRPVRCHEICWIPVDVRRFSAISEIYAASAASLSQGASGSLAHGCLGEVGLMIDSTTRCAADLEVTSNASSVIAVDQQSASSSFLRTTHLVRQRWLWPILAAGVLAIIGWVVHSRVEASMQEMLADKVETILQADVSAMTTWLRSQERIAKSWAYDPILRKHTDEVLALTRVSGASAESLIGSEPVSDLHHYLFPYMDPLGFGGYLVIDAERVIVASDQVELIGTAAGAAHDPLFDRLFAGEVVVTRPFASRAMLPSDDGASSAGQPVMYAAAPMIDADQNVFAIVCLRIRPGENFSAMLRAARSGRTGETYAFDATGMMISESRFREQLRAIGLIPDLADSSAMLSLEVRDPGVDLTQGNRPEKPRREQPLTRMVQSATSGSSGVDVDGYRDYRGVPVIGAWKWLPEYEFGIATEIDYDEAYQSVAVLRTSFLTLFGLLCASAIAVNISMVTASKLRRAAASASRRARRLGQYHLEEMIGEGGMGEVFRASHAMLQRPTAVKLLKPERSDPLSTARFEREVQLSSRLTHPNTIQIYDYGRTEDDVFYYAMEYLDGITLAELIEREGSLPVGRIIDILLQVCGSLAEAHGTGLIHRDIKPANIMITCRGGIADFVKVLDFGLAKGIGTEASATVTVANAVAGTPLYLSPEATRGSRDLDHRSDIYSLGIVAFEMLCGRPPFQGDSAVEICMQHVSKQPEWPNAAEDDGRDDGLRELIEDCLRKGPEDRPENIELVRQRLLELPHDSDGWNRRCAQDWWSDLAASGSCEPTSPTLTQNPVTA